MATEVLSEVERLRLVNEAAAVFVLAHARRAPDYPIWTISEREAAGRLYTALRLLLGEDA